MANDAEYLQDRHEVQFEVPVPQNYRYCVDTYERMRQTAQTLSAQQTGSVEMTVWEGFFTKLITEELNLSVPYYSTIRRELIRMECIRQMRRGGGSSPSQWELLQPPTEELWHNAPPKRAQTNSKQDATAGQVTDLHKRLERLEEHMEVILSALTGGDVKLPFDGPKREGAGPKVYETRDGG
jgi:hypothetical protein